MGVAGGARLCLVLGCAYILLGAGVIGASAEQPDADTALQHLIDEQAAVLITSDPALYTPLFVHNNSSSLQPRSSQQTPQTRSSYLDVINQIVRARLCAFSPPRRPGERH